ncbi:MAG: hypothetical protein K0S27_1491 [Gammaproteobacteria bacterium]|jgi:hypothetical protein|nr:hypothetical protein [Gammaproteobacteria bacterium]
MHARTLPSEEKGDLFPSQARERDKRLLLDRHSSFIFFEELLKDYQSLSSKDQKQIAEDKLGLMVTLKGRLEFHLLSPSLISEEKKAPSVMHSWGWMGIGLVFFHDVVIGEGGPFAGMFTLLSHLFSYVFSAASLALFSSYGLAAVAVCSLICVIDCIVNYAIFGPLLKNIFGVSSLNSNPSLFAIQRESVETTGRINNLLLQAHLDPKFHFLVEGCLPIVKEFNKDIINLNESKQPYVAPLSTQLKEGGVLAVFAVLTAGNAYFVTMGFLSIVASSVLTSPMLPVIISAIIMLQVMARLISRMQSIHHLFNPEEKEIQKRDKELKNFFKTNGPECIEKLKIIPRLSFVSTMSSSSDGDRSPAVFGNGVSGPSRAHSFASI